MYLFSFSFLEGGFFQGEGLVLVLGFVCLFLSKRRKSV